MAPKSIFDLVQGNLVNIVEYACDHHKKFGRPPRLAVNASSWWYTNMTWTTVQEIRNRRGSGLDANPAEAKFLHFALRILHLGIQLHLVFDGPRKLHNGGKAHPGYDPATLLIRETLTRLAIPWHDAPGEAEAECAAMEAEGLADAVWSEDGDALAFGCQTLIRSHREISLSNERTDEPKSYKDFKIYRLEDVEHQYPGMNREGFILHALLCRAGKVSGGLPNFEPEDAFKAAHNDLGKSLPEASTSKAAFERWLDTELTTYLGENDLIFGVRDYPTYDQLEDYVFPHVSSQEALLNLVWTGNMSDDEAGLFSFLADKFQWKPKKWPKWIVPLKIVRSLVATEPGQESQHDHLKLECALKKMGSKKVRATFLLKNATSVELPTITDDRCPFETLVWILRKARLNGHATITSYFTTTSPHLRAQGYAKESTLGKQVQRPAGALNDAMTPTSNERPTYNGESSSQIRQRTPPSPSFHRNISRSKSRRTNGAGSFTHLTSNESMVGGGEGYYQTCAPSPIEHTTPISPSAPKDTTFEWPRENRAPALSYLSTPISNQKETEVDNGEGSSKAFVSTNRQKTPPTPSRAPKGTRPTREGRHLPWNTTKNISGKVASATKTSMHEDFHKRKTQEIQAGPRENAKRGRSSRANNDTGNNRSKKMKQVVIDLTSPLTDSEDSAGCMLVSSQSEFGSAPSSQDFLNLPRPIPAKVVETVKAFDRSESDDEWGSYPSSPDLIALL